MSNNYKFERTMLIVLVVGVVMMLVCTCILMFGKPGTMDSDVVWLTALGFCIGFFMSLCSINTISEMEDYDDYEYIVYEGKHLMK